MAIVTRATTALRSIKNLAPKSKFSNTFLPRTRHILSEDATFMAGEVMLNSAHFQPVAAKHLSDGIRLTRTALNSEQPVRGQQPRQMIRDTAKRFQPVRTAI